MSKNLQKVQDMLDGNYQTKIQVGYGDQEVERHEIGDTWIDSDGIEWEQKNGYRIRINNKMANVGIFKAKCKTCNKGILKQWDKDTHKADGRCYHCQLNYELDLKFDKPIRWFAYRRLKELINMDAIHNDMEKWVFERDKILKQNPFDKKVANAMANSEVELTINKNKAMS
jgi:hypothetical protein|tara:strand:+ start:349 stop:861 length:513 start_codon:yes stop_codon:yes gene_type:complete